MSLFHRSVPSGRRVGFLEVSISPGREACNHFPTRKYGRQPDNLKGEGRGMPEVRRVGGIDFGFHNPFAAVWGVLDASNVLWLAEAGQYRYRADDAQRGSKVPVDKHYHTLAALRYLVSRLDDGFFRKILASGGHQPAEHGPRSE